MEWTLHITYAILKNTLRPERTFWIFFSLLCSDGGINCQLCDENGALHQYAHEATSPHACDSTGYWTPEEAVGWYSIILYYLFLIVSVSGQRGITLVHISFYISDIISPQPCDIYSRWWKQNGTPTQHATLTRAIVDVKNNTCSLINGENLASPAKLVYSHSGGSLSLERARCMRVWKNVGYKSLSHNCQDEEHSFCHQWIKKALGIPSSLVILGDVQKPGCHKRRCVSCAAFRLYSSCNRCSWLF